MNALLFFFLCAPAHADTLACRANFDASARYDLTAAVDGAAIQGDVDFRYHDEDHDLRASLKTSAQELTRGSAVHLSAANANMQARVDADFQASAASYDGALHVSFAVDNVPPVDLPVSCTWR